MAITDIKQYAHLTAEDVEALAGSLERPELRPGAGLLVDRRIRGHGCHRHYSLVTPEART